MGETLEVRIGARAHDGEANAELLRFLAADVLGVRQADVELDRGARSRHKAVLVDMHIAPSDTKSRQHINHGAQSAAGKRVGAGGGKAGGAGKLKRAPGGVGADDENSVNDDAEDERRMRVQSVLARLREAMTR